MLYHDMLTSISKTYVAYSKKRKEFLTWLRSSHWLHMCKKKLYSEQHRASSLCSNPLLSWDQLAGPGFSQSCVFWCYNLGFIYVLFMHPENKGRGERGTVSKNEMNNSPSNIFKYCFSWRYTSRIVRQFWQLQSAWEAPTLAVSSLVSRSMSDRFIAFSSLRRSTLRCRESISCFCRPMVSWSNSISFPFPVLTRRTISNSAPSYNNNNKNTINNVILLPLPCVDAAHHLQLSSKLQQQQYKRYQQRYSPSPSLCWHGAPSPAQHQATTIKY